MRRHLHGALVLLGMLVVLVLTIIGCESDQDGGGIIATIDATVIDATPIDAGGDVVVPGDSAPPPKPFNVTAVTSTSSTRVQVTFSDPPNAVQAAQLGNYSVPGLTLTGTPTLQGNVVSIQTSAQAAQSYTMTVSNVTRGTDGQALTGGTGTFTGRAPFNVASAQSESAVSITVTFDAAPNATQATNLANYAVPGLTLAGTPTLQGNTVTIETSTQNADPYTVTVSNVTRASDGEPLTVAAKTFNGTVSFNVASAASTGNTSISVTFDAAPTAAQATTLANYSVPGLTLSGTPALQGNTVTITTSSQSAQEYTVTVSNVTRASDSEPLIIKERTFTGRTSFNVVSAASTSTNTITVTFDAPPTNAEATTLANYTVNGLTLSGTPTLSGSTVTITTADQAAQEYTVTVANVTRASDGEVLANASATFNGRTPFNVQSAQSVSSLAVSVTFDATPNSAQATTLANYDIPGLTLSGTPVLVGNTVTITTTRQANQSYTVTVNNVTRASDGEPLKAKTAGFTGKPRANLLITEVAPENATGEDFIELVATAAGDIQGLTLRQVSGTIYTFAALDLAVGDRIVVNLTGLPGPAGFVQEDVAKNANASTAPFATAAYDVYSSNNGVPGTDNVVAIVDDLIPAPIDAVAYSNRDGDAAAAAMTAYALARSQSMWSFTAAPVDGTNDCATQAETVNVATTETNCGGFDVDVTPGVSIQRIGTTDTNTRNDWYVAASTRGAGNAAIPAPGVVSAVATSATTVDVRFNQEVRSSTVTLAGFTFVPTLSVTAATLSAANRVTLTTATQQPPAYVVTVANSVTSINGAAFSAPNNARFCSFVALPALVRVNEVQPDRPGGNDLIELLVTRGGPLTDYQVRLNPVTAPGASGTLLATLPAICSQAGDFVVIHLTPGANDAPTSETLSKSENPSSTYSENYDTAWDVRGTNNDPPATSAVIAVRGNGNTYVDAVPFTSMTPNGGTPPTQTVVDSLAFIQGQGLWLPATCFDVLGAPAACTIQNAPNVMAVWQGVNVTNDVSMQRFFGPTNAQSWFPLTPSSFGAENIFPR